MPMILLLGEDYRLLRTRAAMLNTLGAECFCCTPDEVTAKVGGATFQLVVLCHSIPYEIRDSIGREARRRWPGVQLLQMLKSVCETNSAGVHADAVALAGDPRELLTRAVQLLGKYYKGLSMAAK